jgi:4-hydroxybenzoate polyprenyltransferase/phosphoserine phosphatase
MNSSFDQNREEGPSSSSTLPPNVLCADVDGTVIRTDLLYESFLAAIKTDFSVLLRAPLWCLRGRAELKAQLAARSNLSIANVPLNEKVVSYLREEAAKGRKVVLASASHKSLVEKLADRLNFISEVLGTEGEENLKGASKATALVSRFGEGGFEYAGDSVADIAVWKRAGAVTVVTSSRRFSEKITTQFPHARVFETPAFSGITVLRACRVYQWLKNILVFVPVLLAHRWADVGALAAAFGALASFSLCASGVYILNDLLDLESDREHSRKRRRPFASGELPIPLGFVLSPALFICGFIIAASVSLKFSLVLALYLVLTTAYSFKLKQIVLIDIILLAILYTVRIIGGGVASQVAVSQWLLGISMFMFFSLACVKRFSELLVLRKKNERFSRGRGYVVDDMEQIAMFGASSAYIAVLVLALYVSSKEVVELYRTPWIIWLGCPLMLYWVSRVWLLARRGRVHDDPLVFAMRDKVTYVVGLIALVILAAAKW